MDDDDDDRLISDEERKVMLEDIRKVLFASDNLPLPLDLMKDFENCDDWELIEHHRDVVQAKNDHGDVYDYDESNICLESDSENDLY